MTIPGFTSTGSKRPAAMYGDLSGVPRRMTRAKGCRVWDEAGNEYLDLVMGMGAVSLGYAHPDVAAAAERAIRDGVVGPLPPVLEQEVAERLAAVIPGAESVRFLKTGAEAVAAAVRIARVYTGREHVISCGYHGWLDWCQDSVGVPLCVTELRREVPFNDPDALERAAQEFSPVAAIVIEPVIDAPPDSYWLKAVRRVATHSEAVLIFDEVKTAFRIAIGGAAERYGAEPDLVVVGKALGNGFPLSAVCGPAELMDEFNHTWVSSTLATEYVSLAAARAVLEVFQREDAIGRIRLSGQRLKLALERIAAGHAEVFGEVRGMPEMCYLSCPDPKTSAALAASAAARGLILKRTAYNYVSSAHTDEVMNEALARLEEAAHEVARSC